MKKSNYEVLAWDSDFFLFKVARINKSNEEDFKEVLDSLSKSEINLVYYSSKVKLPTSELISPFFEGHLVDVKMTYFKEIERPLPLHPSITKYDKEYPSDKLFELAIGSGVYSRFNVDKKIPNSKFEELYKLWIINSVNKKIAREVFIYSESGAIVGFITAGVKNERANVGITAVDKNHRGKGIGKGLISAVERWSGEQNYSTIQVVTQGANSAACILYEKCGFRIESSEYFYHFWRV